MGFAKVANRRAAAKGHELTLIAAMEYTGHLYRIHDPTLGPYLAHETSQWLDEARERGYDIEEVQSIEKVNDELEYLNYYEESESALEIISPSAEGWDSLE